VVGLIHRVLKKIKIVRETASESKSGQYLKHEGTPCQWQKQMKAESASASGTSKEVHPTALAALAP
jgi:hypothetical protein